MLPSQAGLLHKPPNKQCPKAEVIRISSQKKSLIWLEVLSVSDTKRSEERGFLAFFVSRKDLQGFGHE
jgi:hypothetical protein